MDFIAGSGRLNLVQFVHEHRSEGFSCEVITLAAASRHLDIVMFLHENRNDDCIINAMDEAARRGYFEILKFLHENRKKGAQKALWPLLLQMETSA